MVAAVGALYLLQRQEEYGRVFMRVGVIAGPIRAFADFSYRRHAWQIRGKHQPVASLEWKVCSSPEPGAAIVLMGQPNEETDESTIRW